MLYINGEWRETDNELEVLNPANNKLIKTVYHGGKEETIEAIASATEAFKTWRKVPGVERGAYLDKVVTILRARTNELAEIITKENGKPLQDALGEVVSGINYVEWYAEEAKRVYGDVLPASHTDKHLMVVRQPVGVSAAITPWNFPFSMITRKLAPALAAGCTVVLKPAAQTPLSAIAVYEAFHEAELPDGVVNLVMGPAAEIGNEMTSSPDVRKITFTGSTAIGKLLLRESADTVKKVSMELGGHAPFIVFEDADIDEAITGVLNSKFRNAGQTCISTNRIYVEESIAEEFGTRLAQKVSALTIGDGLEEGTDVGPLIDQGAIDTVSSQVENAIKHNGKILCGGKVHENKEGNFFQPTVIQHASDDMDIATEETFGPIAPIFTFKTEEEAIERANHKYYGLAAYCFTNDLGRGLRMMEELEYGIIGINDPAPVVIQAPFGGIKQSGIGSEGGKYGLEEYLEDKFVSIGTRKR